MRNIKSSARPPRPAPGAATAAPALNRSGAVARMMRMPVATLRVWERRYGLTHPELTPSGQRLYSADDVRRLVLIKQLTDLGHAIGSLAPLGMLLHAYLLRVTTASRAHFKAALEHVDRREGLLLHPSAAS